MVLLGRSGSGKTTLMKAVLGLVETSGGEILWKGRPAQESPVIELRRQFFQESERRRIVAASVADPGWMETVLQSPGPYFLVAEAVLVYLEECEVRSALAQIARTPPGSTGGSAFARLSPCAAAGGAFHCRIISRRSAPLCQPRMRFTASQPNITIGIPTSRWRTSPNTSGTMSQPSP